MNPVEAESGLPVQPVDMIICARAHVGCRFLTVRHRVIVAKVWDATTFVALRAGADVDAKHLASFEAASLSERSLRFADLTASELFAVDLTDADLRRANLNGVTVKKGVLTKAQLQGTELREAQLQGADLGGAKLQGASLFGAQLQGASLELAQLQGASLELAQLQGAFLQQAQLQGVDLIMAKLQGADLRQAGLWNIVANYAQLGLADLREANFDAVSAEDLLAQLPAGTPDAAKQQVRDALTAKAGGTPLLKADTIAGKMLVTNKDDAVWQGLDRTAQLTTERAEIDPALAELLADKVAPITPGAAEVVAQRVTFPAREDKQRPLIKLLGCRLQTQVDTKRVTLRAQTIDGLLRATGPCDPASPTPRPATGPRNEAPW